MQLTKFRHSCVRVEQDDRSLVFDPGVFSDIDAALDGADAVLITHEHPDHIDVERVRQALTDNPRLRLWGPRAVADSLDGFGEQVVAVGADEAFDAAGFAVRTFGRQHAVLHPLVPVIANVGYLIDGAVFHPGDAFTVPPVPVQALLLPAQAPWSKISEVIDYTIAVRAPKAYPIHDVLVTEVYGGLLQSNLAPIAATFDIEFASFDEPVHV